MQFPSEAIRGEARGGGFSLLNSLDVFFLPPKIVKLSRRKRYSRRARASRDKTLDRWIGFKVSPLEALVVLHILQIAVLKKHGG